MKIKRFMTVREDGSTALFVRPPRLAANEISIALDVEVPDAIFRKPSLSARIVVPDGAGMPAEIGAEVIENAKAAIEQATGLRFAISLVPPEEDGE